MDKEISLDLGINAFKDNLINLIGNSQLPIGVTYYVLKDVFNEIQKLYNETLAKEQQELLETLKKEEENNQEEPANEEEKQKV